MGGWVLGWHPLPLPPRQHCALPAAAIQCNPTKGCALLYLQAEVEALSRDGGIPQDDMLLKALSHPAPHELPWFAGVHCYPLYPGPAAK